MAPQAGSGGYPVGLNVNADAGLNARQRKQVYMHSSIFDTEGPTTKSVYAPNRQREMYHSSIRMNTAKVGRTIPDMSLPSPADIQCTQNAGHGVVMPCSHSGAWDSDGRTLGMTPRQSGPEVLVGDGELLQVVRANKQDPGMPKEWRQTNTNLQWHDQRNEISRSRTTGLPSAQENKRKEFSSEIFGTDRRTNASTTLPKQELRFDITPDPRDMGLSSAPGSSGTNAANRHARNLAGSIEKEPEPSQKVPLEPQEDPQTNDRRRGEKNYSELFGTQMAPRRDVQGREEVTGTRTCSFLDIRSEIAVRNKDRWKGDKAHETGTLRSDTMRKEAERDSTLFDRQAKKVEMDQQAQATNQYERACWDTKDIMMQGAEIARRVRMREHEDMPGQTPLMRRQNDLSSDQVSKGLGVAPALTTYGSQASATPRASPLGRPITPRETRLASMQSNIFG
eukprot:gnl/TRDRNA2_/TRDRNA2_185919_c0_seq1.p1 gnl/TRDRNA2_/TRDRNA2_185919_c0~~gnl/TRDRNA2_/TRDRNA2_185919_c0_seq1.p1  ORF type:complete len:451 (-),score=67.69 gnl/TRDRNA2_/TRDRNA2_185919_c0_seq1:48-1400(-)